MIQSGRSTYLHEQQRAFFEEQRNIPERLVRRARKNASKRKRKRRDTQTHDIQSSKEEQNLSSVQFFVHRIGFC